MHRAAAFVLAISAGLARHGAAETRRPNPPAANHVIRMTATAYCQTGLTKSGAWTQPGFIAADTRILPVGSVVRVETSNGGQPGIYTVMDTGTAVRGRRIDIYMPNCRRARRFGRRAVRVHVLGPAAN